jgi:hypothetical protein
MVSESEARSLLQNAAEMAGRQPNVLSDGRKAQPRVPMVPFNEL